jgi:crotonobetainyl-CoA:carnitine CoA-transferase CaiB-like acyl-CoA transferase
MLTDLGAQVIKVEPPTGDMTRFTYPRVNSQSTYFVQQNVGKLNVSIDMDQQEGVDLAARLIEAADVVVENFRPGVMDRLGLGYSRFAEKCPRLIYTSISGYGATGPWTSRRAYAPVVNAETGITKYQGDVRDGTYANDPHSHGDVYTAVETASAILAALYQRERTGRGQYIDVSMAETMLYVNEHAHNQLWDQPVPQGTIRSFQPADYPVLTTKDGSVVVVSGHPAEKGTFEFFVGAMESPQLLSDPRFSTIESRLNHFDELMEAIVSWAVTVSDADEIEARFARHGLATGRLRSVGEIADTEWARDRGAITEVSDRKDGAIRVPNSPWHFSSSDTSVTGVAKYRGEDNREVCTTVLGMSDADITHLESIGVLVSRVPQS